MSGGILNLLLKSNITLLAYRYATNLDNRFLRAAVLAAYGPAFYKRRLWKRFLTPDAKFQPVPLNPRFEGYLQNLRADGIAIIEGHEVFERAAARLLRLVDELGLTGYRRRDKVTDFLVDVGWVVPEVMQMLADPQLCGLFCNYYGRQAYYREHPLVLASSAGDEGVDRSSSRVHCDGYRQLTMQLLVNDTSDEDSHLVFYAGSHATPKLDVNRDQSNINLVDSYRPVLGTGRSGTLVLFDSGAGYHCGVYKPGQRVILTQVVTSGWLPFKDRMREDSDALRGLRERFPPHVRAAFERL